MIFEIISAKNYVQDNHWALVYIHRYYVITMDGKNDNGHSFKGLSVFSSHLSRIPSGVPRTKIKCKRTHIKGLPFLKSLILHAPLRQV